MAVRNRPGADPRELLDRFPALRVVVIGDAMLDVYLDGRSHRLCPEAPVPVVDVAARAAAPGGAANVAVNARALGADVRLVTLVGNDRVGAGLRKALEARGVPSSGLVTEPGRRTLAKVRVSADGQLLVRVDHGDTREADRRAATALGARLEAWGGEADAVIVSDYGYGVMSPPLRELLRDLQQRGPRVLVVDAKDLRAYRDVGVTAVKPNRQQASTLLGTPLDGADPTDRIAARGERLLAITGARIGAVTLDAEGAVVVERGRPAYRTYARPLPHASAAGAGDTFAAALALSLAAGADVPAAAEVASAAAALVVTRRGTTPCAAEELRQRFRASGKLLPLDRLRARVAALRAEGRRIVFTNGCFDLVHRGHVQYLSEAKRLGDVLVVGVNDDASVRRLKGAARPINRLADRIEVLAALSCVDHVVPFGEDTPEELIRLVAPDVFVKGGDYSKDRLPEAALVERLGGVVRILPLIEDVSTTAIIERIREEGRSRGPELGRRAEPAVR